MAASVSRTSAGGSRSSGASSPLTASPSRAYGQPAKLCHTSRVAPASRAAASRWSVPSVRSRLVMANALSKLRPSLSEDSAVSWWTTASGRAASTASRTAAASSGSSDDRLGAHRPDVLRAARGWSR